jgi:hypothetical protein
MNTSFRHSLRLPSWSEAVLWPLALALLYWWPVAEGPSLCVYHHLGISWCPGCGLGTALHHLLHGHWTQSWAHHKLAGPVAFMLLFRSLRVLITTTRPLWKPRNYSN